MPSPPPIPKNTCVSTVFSEFQHCIGWWRGTSKVYSLERVAVFYGGDYELQEITNAASLCEEGSSNMNL